MIILLTETQSFFPEAITLKKQYRKIIIRKLNVGSCSKYTPEFIKSYEPREIIYAKTALFLPQIDLVRTYVLSTINTAENDGKKLNDFSPRYRLRIAASIKNNWG